MASAISESSVFEANVIGPDDGDPRNAASVREGLQDLANRTKHLNDNKANLSGATFTGAVTTTAGFAASSGPINITGTGSLSHSGSGGASFSACPVTHTNGAFLPLNVVGLTDANTSIGPTGGSDQYIDGYRVPAITANRTYTFSATAPTNNLRKVVRITRIRTADAFTATIKRNGGTTLAVIDASAAGWVELEYAGTDWVVSSWGGSVSSILAAD